MREIVFDTETTGLDPCEGHRIIEIGAIEVVNRLPTGEQFHCYINPQREVEASAVRVHGLTNEKLMGMPVFEDVAAAFRTFVGDSPLVAHNASFDINFLNYEYLWANQSALANEVIDTLAMAREKFPGSQVSLDALCRRFDVDLSGRTRHGALLDAELLANVYLELTGGQQPALSLIDEGEKGKDNVSKYKQTKPRPPRNFDVPPDELKMHQEFVATISGNLWAYS